MGIPEIFKNPKVAIIMGVVLGLLLGLVIGWGLWPVQWKDADPAALSQYYQEQYMRMAIDSYRVNPDADLAYMRWLSMGENAPRLLKAIYDKPEGRDLGDVLNFQTAIESRLGSKIQIPAGGQPPVDATQPAGQTPSVGVNWTPYIIFGVLLALSVIGGALYYFVLRPILYGRQQDTGEISAARQAQEISKSVERTDFSGLGLAKPITQTMTTYVLGDDLYDESFSIDSPAGDFLGEYGVGVSETMGVGEPKKVTAIEIWLFDKNDIKTATKVLMSPHAFKDINLRGRLEAKGELVLIEPQGQVMLETATLQLLATVVDLEYGRGNLPDNSYFERITLELAIWPKQ